jgi:hypothetical protein
MLNDLYKEKINDNNEYVDVLYKKDLVTRKFIDTNNIISVDEALNRRGIPYKNRCIIVVGNSEKTFIVKHSFDYVKNLMSTKNINGFYGRK